MLDALDDELTATPRTPPERFRNQVRALTPGETVCKAQRLSLTGPEVKDLKTFFRRFRQTVDPFVSKERKTSLKDFTVEQGTVLTDAGYVLAFIAVTRT